MNSISMYFIPAVILTILGAALVKKVPIFQDFISGAKEGAKSCVSILPSLIGLITAVSMLKASGALDMFSAAMAPVAGFLKIPREVIPLALLRPVSGGGSIALLENLIKSCGPDSTAGRIAAVMAGATETTFYTITVYFGAIGVKKTGYALPAALAADFCSFIMAGATVKLFFGAA